MALAASLVAASTPVIGAQDAPPPMVRVRPIEAPARRLPSENASAGVTRFAFVAYGDTRSGSQPGVPGDGEIIHPEHSRIIDRVLERHAAARATAFPIRFVLQSGDAVLRGGDGAMWNVSFSPIIDRLSRAGLPYFLAAGNHDVTGRPAGDPQRSLGLHNTLSAIANLIPPEGSPRRLNGYPTYAFGYGNLFAIALDSNIPEDPVQLAWATDQLEHLDRDRYRHVVIFLHHPAYTSGSHGGARIESQSQAIRDVYMPLFRAHHVRVIIAGHDHLYDHWVERYTHDGTDYRMDQIVTGGGGAPSYRYTAEPDLTAYLDAGAAENVRVEHLARPSPNRDENPHHFIILRVDGEQLSLEVVGTGPTPFRPFAGRATLDMSR